MMFVESRHSSRRQLNRLVVVLVLPAALVSIAITGGFGRDRAARAARARRSARRWVMRLIRLTGVRIDVVGRVDPAGPDSGRGQLIVANHSSPLDIPALIVARPDARFAAAQDLFRVPLLAGAMRSVGAVPVDRRRGTGVHLEDSSEEDGPLVVFPEGAIAPPGGRLPFRRGAFSLAIESGVDVLPVAIHGSDLCLAPKGRLGVRPGTVTVEFLPPISTAGLTHEDRHELCARAQQAIFEALEALDRFG
jgi:1-acyl-sn-glycerol-3-phosphate acyltransferase